MSAKDDLALVTGACGGLGQACARLLGRCYALARTDIDQGRLEALAGTLEAEGYRITLATAGLRHT